jgi:hypothetical protein
MNNGLAVFLVLLALAVFVFNLWLFVVGVQFLRTGTRAFKLYTAQNARPGSPPPLPHRVRS